MNQHLHSRSQGRGRALTGGAGHSPGQPGRQDPWTALQQQAPLRGVATVGGRYTRRTLLAGGGCGIQQGRPPVACRSLRTRGPCQPLRRDDSRHCGMRVLHVVQCARRDGDGTAGSCLHRTDDKALRHPGPRNGPAARRRRLRTRRHRPPDRHPYPRGVGGSSHSRRPAGNEPSAGQVAPRRDAYLVNGECP